MLDLEEWKKKANEERNAKINRLENEQRKRVAELDGINSKLKNLNKEKTEKLDSLKLEWNKQQQALAAEKKTQAEVIGKEEKEEQRRISSIKTEYEADMQKELHSQGADTERLQDIANQLAQLEKELSFIKENATLVIEYQKDKRDLIDRIPGWQREHDEQKTSAPIGTGNAESGNILPTRKNRPSEQRMGRSGRKCKGTAKEPGGLQQDSGIRLV